MLAAKQHFVGRLETLGDVVRVQNGNGCGVSKAGCTHHADVHPRNRQDRCGTERRRRHRTEGLFGVVLRIRG